MSSFQYPVFCGRVLGVPAIIEFEKDTFTLVDYLTIKDEPTEEKVREIFAASLFKSPELEQIGEEYRKKVKRATIPMRLDPAMLEGAEIRTRFAEIKTKDKRFKTYEIEFIKGRREAAADILMTFAQPRHSGFKYIKILEEIV